MQLHKVIEVHEKKQTNYPNNTSDHFMTILMSSFTSVAGTVPIILVLKILLGRVGPYRKYISQYVKTFSQYMIKYSGVLD